MVPVYIVSSVVNMINPAGSFPSVFLSPAGPESANSITSLTLLLQEQLQALLSQQKNCWNPHIELSLGEVGGENENEDPVSWCCWLNL